MHSGRRGVYTVRMIPSSFSSLLTILKTQRTRHDTPNGRCSELDVLGAGIQFMTLRYFFPIVHTHTMCHSVTLCESSLGFCPTGRAVCGCAQSEPHKTVHGKAHEQTTITISITHHRPVQDELNGVKSMIQLNDLGNFLDTYLHLQNCVTIIV